jgi:DtxR family Mn-dependent transcriptional regulator
MHTQAVEDYLKAIYSLELELGKVTTTTLAEWLGVMPGSVTGMLKKLAGMGVVTYEPYRGVALTEEGRRVALEVIRHHRLVELYLTQVLGVPWDQVHDEAEKWEHVISEDIEERIDQFLGHPTADPHGAPIPARDGTVKPAPRVPLATLAPGQSATVVEVSDRDPSLLRYAASLGLFPGVALRVVAAPPFDGPLTICVGDAELALGRGAAGQILVTPVAQGAAP